VINTKYHNVNHANIAHDSMFNLRSVALYILPVALLLLLRVPDRQGVTKLITGQVKGLKMPFSNFSAQPVLGPASA
jgi:hypothetical protein